MATGNKKSNKKKNDGPDLLTVVIVLVAIILVIVLIVNYRKDKDGKEPTTGTPTTGATNTPGAPTDAVTPDTKPTTKPTATPAPTVTQDPEQDMTTPAPTEEPMLSVEAAEGIVSSNIDLDADAFTVELLDDHLMIDGAEYYSFCVNDKNGEAMEPLLIVDKKAGTLYCYDFSGVVSQFSKFPLDKTETGSTGTEVISAEEAKGVLSGYSKEKLGLAMEPSAYEMTVDDWTTVIKGKECYGVNLFETTDGKQRFRGVFYVTLDGSAVYSEDGVTGDFIER